MKNPILIHNSHDSVSVQFKDYLDSIGFKYCLLDWYTPHDAIDPKRNFELAWRLVEMTLFGAFDPEPKVGPLPPVEFTDKDIEEGFYPEEFDRWVMQCECHSGLGYIGPNISVLPSLVFELDSGELGIWECSPERNEGKVFTVEDLVPEKMRESVAPGLHLAGQTIESAMSCASSPYYGNAIMQEAVRRHIKKFMTVDLREPEKELVTINREVKHDSHRPL